ncbi:MAG: helix-turn-helix transcriptional regulator [Bacilli bacterium]|jgi:DNA-binding transcriptional regulator YiaG
MASIQKIIIERLLALIRIEIKKYIRFDAHNRMKVDLAECQKRLLKLEKAAEAQSKETFAIWLDRMRTNGKSLKALRKKLAITQKELSILLDTNPATVNRWESGRVRLSRKSCEKVAKIRSFSKIEAKKILTAKAVRISTGEAGNDAV